MITSILHRATGIALSVGGLALLTWWLLALAGSGTGYEDFGKVAGHPLGILVLIGLTWSFFQHLLSGLRHLIMDVGAGFELSRNKTLAIATWLLSAGLTLILWAYLLLGARA